MPSSRLPDIDEKSGGLQAIDWRKKNGTPVADDVRRWRRAGT